MNYLIQLAICHSLSILTLCFVLGITAGYHISLFSRATQFTTLFVSVLLIVFLGAVCLAKKTVQANLRVIFLVFLGTGLGLLHINLATQLPSAKNHIYHKITAKQEAVVIGTMAAMARSTTQGASTIIESHWLRLPTDTTFSPTTGKLLVRLNGRWPSQILPGDRVVVRADLKRPRSFRSPGAFDYARYLAEKEIWITGFIRSPLFLQKITNNQPPHLLPRILFFTERCRSYIAGKLNKLLPPDKAGLYRAILLGDRSGISRQTIEYFKACGVLHLLAISGLHLTVLWTLFYFFWYWLLGRSRFLLLHSSVHTLAAVFTLPFLVAYAFLAGLQMPVARAVIMSSVVVLAILARKRVNAASLLCCAILLLLLIQPMQLFRASFQLSFIAVAAIFFLLPSLRKLADLLKTTKKDTYDVAKLRKKAYWIYGALLLSAGISVLTAPITIFHFNRISCIGPLANLVLEPLLCLWTLSLGIISVPFLLAGNDTAALFFLTPGAAGLELAVTILEKAAALPFAFRWISAPEPSFFQGTLCFYCGLIFWIIAGEKIAGTAKKIQQRVANICKIIGSGLLLISCILFGSSPPPQNRVSFLDVGQGSATLLEFANGQTTLIDGGGPFSPVSSVGERVIAPYLLRRGKTTVDQIVVTHPDADHSNGLEYILNNFPPKILWLRAHEQHPIQQRLEKLAENRGCRVQIPQNDEKLFLQKDNSLICLYNFGKPQYPTSAREKNRGIVVVATIGKIRLFFPGDIDKKAEHQLVSLTSLKPAEILLAAHHGSKTSNSTTFLATIDPEIVIVSAGDKEGIFPSHTLIRQLHLQKKQLLTTAHYGTIEIEIGKDNKPKLFYYTKEANNPLKRYRRTRYAKELFSGSLTTKSAATTHS